MTTSNEIATAMLYTAAGLSILPVAGDGTKGPRLDALPQGADGKPTWKPFQEHIATESELVRLFGRNGKPTGIGIIGGKVSGNLEIIDIDDPADVEPYRAEVEAAAPGLLAKLPQARTPRPGLHIYYRHTGEPEGNLKLALSEPRPQFDKLTGEPIINKKTGKQRIAPDTLMETRGEGGYVVAPGSPPACHPTGRTYEHVAGPTLLNVPTITTEERDVLLTVARSFNKLVDEPERKTSKTKTPGVSPGDDYASKTQWEQILEPHGWAKVSARGDVTTWRRPGKSCGSISATTGLTSKMGADLLCVFSSNAHPFSVPSGKACGTFTKFGAYALLEHGCDFNAAAKALAAQGFGERRKATARDEVSTKSDSTDDRPTIALSTDEHLNIAETIEALASNSEIFQRGGQLVDVVNETLPKRRGLKSPPAPRIVPIPQARLRTRLSSCARFTSPRKAENGSIDVAQHPPGWLVKGTAAAAVWPNIRPLEAVVTAPVMRPDGSLLQEPGYDAESGILYVPRREYPTISDVPFADDIYLAVKALNEVVEDFPFERDEHRAGWFAALLTPIARFAFDGPAPLFLVDANVRGAGKGLAVDAAGIIATGDNLATLNYSHNDAEMRKVITSIAMAGDRAVLLDNIGGSFGLPSLDAALTSTKWKDRLLGGNQIVELPLLVSWYATGNNVVLTGDVIRRICHIRLNSTEETPEEREGFRHADLRGWLQVEHPRLLAAALTILRGYVAADRPDLNLKTWGSYEGWSGLVRNAVVYAGLPDPGATRQELAKQADTEGAQLRALLAGWQEIDPYRNGLTVAEVFERLGVGGASTFPTLRAALNDSCTDRNGDKPTPKALAYKLRRFRRRVVGGKCFDTGGDVRGAKKWRVEQ